MNQPAIDWQAALAQHDRWLRTVVLARVREPQAVDEVMQEVRAGGGEAGRADRVVGARWRRGFIAWRCCSRCSTGEKRGVGDGCGSDTSMRPSERGRSPPVHRSAELAHCQRAAVAGAASLSASRRAGRRDPAFEIHRRLELSPDRRPLGHQPRRCRDAAASAQAP